MPTDFRLEGIQIISLGKLFCRQIILEADCKRKETVSMRIIIFRNSDEKNHEP